MRTINQVAHSAHEYVDKTASPTNDQLNKTGDKLKSAWQQFMGYVIAKPLKSLLIAVALGLLLSGMWMEIMFAAMLLLVQNGVDANDAILFSIAFNFLLGMLLWDAISNKKLFF